MGLTVIAQPGLAFQRVVQFLSKGDLVRFNAHERNGDKPFILDLQGNLGEQKMFEQLSTIAVEGLVDNLG